MCWWSSCRGQQLDLCYWSRFWRWHRRLVLCAIPWRRNENVCVWQCLILLGKLLYRRSHVGRWCDRRSGGTFSQSQPASYWHLQRLLGTRRRWQNSGRTWWTCYAGIHRRSHQGKSLFSPLPNTVKLPCVVRLKEKTDRPAGGQRQEEDSERWVQVCPRNTLLGRSWTQDRTEQNNNKKKEENEHGNHLERKTQFPASCSSSPFLCCWITAQLFMVLVWSIDARPCDSLSLFSLNELDLLTGTESSAAAHTLRWKDFLALFFLPRRCFNEVPPLHSTVRDGEKGMKEAITFGLVISRKRLRLSASSSIQFEYWPWASELFLLTSARPFTLSVS